MGTSPRTIQTMHCRILMSHLRFPMRVSCWCQVSIPSRCAFLVSIAQVALEARVAECQATHKLRQIQHVGVRGDWGHS